MITQSTRIRRGKHSVLRTLLPAFMALSAGSLFAQVPFNVPNTPVVIDFDNDLPGVNNGPFSGAGFAPFPAPGQLSSLAWTSWGWQNGHLLYGSTHNTLNTTFARGHATGPAGAAGIYAFSGTGLDGRALGIQPDVRNLNPGSILMRAQNNTSSIITELDVAFDFFYRNNGNRSLSFSVAHTVDHPDFHSEPSLTQVTPTTSTGNAWVRNHKSFNVRNVRLMPGATFYVRFQIARVSGYGDDDEIALDNLVLTPYASTTVYLGSTSSSVSENGGSISIPVHITNPSAIHATEAELVLVSGDASRINGTVFPVLFPAGDPGPIMVPVPVIDNGACDGNADLVFELRSPASAPSATSVSIPHTFNLLVEDDNSSAARLLQDFENGSQGAWPLVAGQAFVSSATSASVEQPTGQRVLSGTSSIQVRNAHGVIEFAPIDISDWQEVVVHARLGSISVGATNGGAGNPDSIAFHVALDGAAFHAIPDIVVRGSESGSARWGYANSQGVAATTAGTPIMVRPAGSGVRTTDGYSTIRISIPPHTRTIALRINARNNSSSKLWVVDDIGISGVECRSIYYSRANGTHETPTWSTSRTGTADDAWFTRSSTMVVQAGHTVQTAPGSAIHLQGLHLETSGTLQLGDATELSLHGGETVFNGQFTGNGATLSFLGSHPMTLAGSANIGIRDLRVDGPAVTQEIPLLTIRHSLDILAGSFDANNPAPSTRRLLLRSTASGTARLGALATTGAFNGRLEIQRHIPAGITNWRFISSPINGARISSLNDDFFTAGFPGSQYPNFYSPVGSTTRWPSIRYYDETMAGNEMLDGLVGVTGADMLMAPGQGFAAWSGSNLQSTSAFEMDINGVPNKAVGGISLYTTYTDSGDPMNDGWNLVGNPLPSPIAFSSLEKGSDIEGFYMVFDPVSGNNATWDMSLGISIPAGALNGHIQSFQGFWIKAYGDDHTITVHESDKVLDPSGGGLFGGAILSGERPMLRLRVSASANGFHDEAVLSFVNGTPEMGRGDIPKLSFTHPEAPRLATMATSGEALTLNAYGSATEAFSIPVLFHAPVAGSYTISLSDASAVTNGRCLELEDLTTGVRTALNNEASYTFQAAVNGAELAQRFILHGTAAVERSATGISCAGMADGIAVISGLGAAPRNLRWMDVDGNLLSSHTAVTGSITFSDLASGGYMVEVDGASACGSLSAPVIIADVQAIELSSAATPASCANANDGAISLTVRGGTAPYSIVWAHGATGAELNGLAGGSYTPTISDAHGCMLNPPAIGIINGDGPVIGIHLESAAIDLGDTLYAYHSGAPGSDLVWDLGDGTTTIEPNGHVYSTPGTYTITLTAHAGDCSNTTSTTITVRSGLSTNGAAGKGQAEMAVWFDGQQIVLTTPANTQAMDIELLDATGRAINSTRMAAGRERITMPTNGLPNGIYFVRTMRKTQQQTLRVSIIR